MHTVKTSKYSKVELASYGIVLEKTGCSSAGCACKIYALSSRMTCQICSIFPESLMRVSLYINNL